VPARATRSRWGPEPGTTAETMHAAATEASTAPVQAGGQTISEEMARSQEGSLENEGDGIHGPSSNLAEGCNLQATSPSGTPGGAAQQHADSPGSSNGGGSGAADAAARRLARLSRRFVPVPTEVVSQPKQPNAAHVVVPSRTSSEQPPQCVTESSQSALPSGPSTGAAEAGDEEGDEAMGIFSSGVVLKHGKAAKKMRAAAVGKSVAKALAAAKAKQEEDERAQVDAVQLAAKARQE
jgi:hypothetical protein